MIIITFQCCTVRCLPMMHLNMCHNSVFKQNFQCGFASVFQHESIYHMFIGEKCLNNNMVIIIMCVVNQINKQLNDNFKQI